MVQRAMGLSPSDFHGGRMLSEREGLEQLHRRHLGGRQENLPWLKA